MSDKNPFGWDTLDSMYTHPEFATIPEEEADNPTCAEILAACIPPLPEEGQEERDKAFDALCASMFKDD